jgi:hypothetical protein
MEEGRQIRRRRRGLVAAVVSAAAVAVALPVSGAFADGGSGTSTDGSTQPVQAQQQDRPDRDDCPEKNGNDGGSASGESVEL